MLPGSAISNEEFIARTGLKLKPDWIVRHSGIQSRHWAEPGVNTSDLAAGAAQMALAAARTEATELELMILATISPDRPTPATACTVQAKIGARCPALDLNSACAGFLFALDYGLRGIETGMQRNLVMGAEIRSRFLNTRDRRTAPLFGDGAGAVILAPCRPDEGIMGLLLQTEGSADQLVDVPAGGTIEPPSVESIASGRHFITIHDAAALTQRGVDAMVDLLTRGCEAFGVPLAEIDLFIPHQANLIMLERAFDRLGIGRERWVLTIAETGNTVGASVPIALDRARQLSAWRPGALVALISLGGGYSGGVALYRVPADDRTRNETPPG